MTLISGNFLLLGILLTVLGWTAISSLKAGRERLEKVYLENFLPTVTLQKTMQPVRDVGFRMVGFLSDQLPAAGCNSKLIDSQKDLESLWSDFLKNTQNDQSEGKELKDQISKGISNFENFSKKLSAAYTAKSKSDVANLFENEWPDIQSNLISPVQKLINAQEDKVKSSYEEALLNEKRTVTKTISIVAFACLCLLLSFWFIMKMSKSLKMFSIKTKSLGTETISLRDLSNRLNEMSEQLSDANQKQSSSYETTSAAMEEMSRTLASNATSMSVSVQIAEQCERATHKGKLAADRMIESIENIHASNQKIMQSFENSNIQINEIISMIKEIGEKTKVINDIVFQTKLLSFNASVEAARAGEHGKGFAVVAEEVGNLAQLSGTAADEISKMLYTNTERVTEIVKQMDFQIQKLIHDGRKDLNQGREVALECQKSLDEIEVNVSEVVKAIHSISSVTQQQSQAVSDVSRSILEVTNTTHINSENAKLINQESHHLAQKSESMHQMVNDLGQIIKGDADSQSDELSDLEVQA